MPTKAKKQERQEQSDGAGSARTQAAFDIVLSRAVQLVPLLGLVVYLIGFYVIGIFLWDLSPWTGSLFRVRYLAAGGSFVAMVLIPASLAALAMVLVAVHLHRIWQPKGRWQAVFSLALGVIAGLAMWGAGSLDRLWEPDLGKGPRPDPFWLFVPGTGVAAGALVAWGLTVLRRHPHPVKVYLIIMAALFWLSLSTEYYARYMYGSVGTANGGADLPVAYVFVDEQGKHVLDAAEQGVAINEIKCENGKRIYSTTLIGVLDEDETAYYLIMGPGMWAEGEDWWTSERTRCVRLAKSNVIGMVFTPELGANEMGKEMARQMVDALSMYDEPGRTEVHPALRFRASPEVTGK